MEAGDIAARRRQVAAGAEQPGTLGVPVGEDRAGDRADVAHEQDPAMEVGAVVRLDEIGIAEIAAATGGVDAEVGVGVDQPGEGPAAGQRLGGVLGVEGQPPVRDPEVDRIAAVGEEDGVEVHGAGG